MHLSNTNRQSQQDCSQIAKPQRLNQAGTIFPPNLPLPAHALMLIFCLRLTLRLRAKYRVLVRDSTGFAFQQLQA